MTDIARLMGDDAAAADARVVRAEVRRLALATGLPSFTLPDGRRTPSDLPVLLVRVTDDDGVQGHSLLWVQRDRQAPLLEAGLRYLADLVEQRSLKDAPGLLGSMRRATAFVGAGGVAAFGVSGLQMAIEDLLCRRRGASLSEVLGRRRDHVRVYQTGLMLHSPVEELLAEAAGMYGRGVRAMKMMVGKPDIGEDVERLEAVKRSLPGDVTLMVDALQRWTVPDALRASERFAHLELAWIEDPIAQDDLDGYRELARSSAVPVATGETCFSMRELRALLEAGIPYIVGELERVGGMGAWIHAAEIVHDSGATMLPHLYPHVSAQILATLPQHEVWLEYVPWFDALVDQGLHLDDGRLPISSAPGSGFTPSPEAVERLACGPWRRLTG
ncbi:mandelate racemase/muconate lactonizing enzyme family protein [Actinomadura sp. KC216]|uniref:mandelate racemase/muconate lactonizing enzyme family protein n=1 Tax=Actinomadura sp. KC216 TaxID=2530370 RepID=UPI00104DA173|nr:mandelate racemase/muconate lactonizing enzyme family protein [Actinomadura sp. KC216]TDB88444.1 mandelate racemase/muconate lactonizing enzyme family protein [Actinomadura sp. KC216]